jgi:hypothetical protein
MIFRRLSSVSVSANILTTSTAFDNVSTSCTTIILSGEGYVHHTKVRRGKGKKIFQKVFGFWDSIMKQLGESGPILQRT